MVNHGIDFTHETMQAVSRRYARVYRAINCFVLMPRQGWRRVRLPIYLTGTVTVNSATLIVPNSR